MWSRVATTKGVKATLVSALQFAILGQTAYQREEEMTEKTMTPKELKKLMERSVAFFPDPDLDKLVLANLAKGCMPASLVPVLIEHEYIYKNEAGDYDVAPEAETHLEWRYPIEWHKALMSARKGEQ